MPHKGKPAKLAERTFVRNFKALTGESPTRAATVRAIAGGLAAIGPAPHRHVGARKGTRAWYRAWGDGASPAREQPARAARSPRSWSPPSTAEPTSPVERALESLSPTPREQARPRATLRARAARSPRSRSRPSAAEPTSPAGRALESLSPSPPEQAQPRATLRARDTAPPPSPGCGAPRSSPAVQSRSRSRSRPPQPRAVLRARAASPTPSAGASRAVALPRRQARASESRTRSPAGSRPWPAESGAGRRALRPRTARGRLQEGTAAGAPEEERSRVWRGWPRGRRKDAATAAFLGRQPQVRSSARRGRPDPRLQSRRRSVSTISSTPSGSPRRWQ